jgi:hypothetical protein
MKMRSPDFVIGPQDDPYLLRWWVIPRNKWFNIYLHKFLHSDEDRALHDHPWVNVSIILRGSYLECLPSGERKVRRRCAVVMRRATAAHRVELIDNKPVWTLFLTGPRIREWFFHCPQGLVHWKAFTKAGEPGQVGPGCDQ